MIYNRVAKARLFFCQIICIVINKYYFHAMKYAPIIYILVLLATLVYLLTITKIH